MKPDVAKIRNFVSKGKFDIFSVLILLLTEVTSINKFYNVAKSLLMIN